MSLERFRDPDDPKGYKGPDGCWYGDMGNGETGALSLVQVGILGMCACWTPAENLQYIAEGLRMLEERSESEKWPEYEDWRARYLAHFGSQNAASFFLYWADAKGYTEHGTSIAGSWLTDKGRQLLSDIDEAIALDTFESEPPQ